MLCTKIFDELRFGKKHSSHYVRCALACILIDVIRSVKNRDIDSKSSKSDMVISDMLTYIHAHFREDLSLSLLSEYIGLTPNYLSKIFNSYIGVPFKAYVIDLKLKYATTLLTQTNTSVTDICYLSGFNSSALFSVHLKVNITCLLLSTEKNINNAL